MTLFNLLVEIFDNLETVENMQRVAAANGDGAIFALPVLIDGNGHTTFQGATKGLIYNDARRFIGISTDTE